MDVTEYILWLSSAKDLRTKTEDTIVRLEALVQQLEEVSTDEAKQVVDKVEKILNILKDMKTNLTDKEV